MGNSVSLSRSSGAEKTVIISQLSAFGVSESQVKKLKAKSYKVDELRALRDKIQGSRLDGDSPYWYVVIYIKLRKRKFGHDRAIEIANGVADDPVLQLEPSMSAFVALLENKGFNISNDNLGAISGLFHGCDMEMLYYWLDAIAKSKKFTISTNDELEVLCDLSTQLSDKEQLFTLSQRGFLEDNEDLSSLRDLLIGHELGGGTTYETIVEFGDKMDKRQASKIKEFCEEVGGDNRLANIVKLYDCFRKQFNKGGADFNVEDLPGLVEQMCRQEESPEFCVDLIGRDYEGDAFEAYTAGGYQTGG